MPAPSDGISVTPPLTVTVVSATPGGTPPADEVSIIEVVAGGVGVGVGVGSGVGAEIELSVTLVLVLVVMAIVVVSVINVNAGNKVSAGTVKFLLLQEDSTSE
jgi:hypothetical protein